MKRTNNSMPSDPRRGRYVSGLALGIAAIATGIAALVTRSSYLGIASVGFIVAIVASEIVLGCPRERTCATELEVREVYVHLPLEKALATAIVPEAEAAPPQGVGSDVAEGMTSRVPPDLEPETVLSVLCEAVAGVCEPVAAHLWLDDPGTATLRLVGAIGPMAPLSRPIPGDDPVLGRSAREGLAELAPVARLKQPDGVRTVWRFALPIRAGEARGVAGVDLACDEEPDRFALGVATAPIVASLVGCLAVHTARIEGRTASELIDIARELSRLLDPTDVVATALRRAMALADAATGSVMLLDEDLGKLVIADSMGLPGDVVARTALSEGEGIAGWVLSTRQPLLVEDLGGRPSGGRRHGVRSAASVPIADADGVLGVINVGSRGFPARFTESHLAALETLGKQTAVALRNARAVAESRGLYYDTLRALAVALETKDPYARGATERVLDTALGVADVLELGESERETLRVAALLHDIGMTVAGDPLALRHQPLSTVEQGLMKLHPQIAAEILDEMPALRDVVPVVYHHHEWYDGGGYLGGLATEEIPLGARILAVADAYVALTSERPYRCAVEHATALGEIRDKAGTQFDPTVVDALAEWLGKSRERSPERK